MSETPRDPARFEVDHAPDLHDDAAAADTADTATHGPATGDTDTSAGTGTGTGDAPGAGRSSGGAVRVDPGPDDGKGRQRRRRRLVVAGISVGAAVVVAALCAGSLALISTIDGFTDSSREARVTRQARDTACLELEGRLNRLAPPGSTANPAGRATAIRNENAALRLYLAQLDEDEQQDDDGDREGGDGGDERGAGDDWRALLDARTSYAEALDRSAQTRTPAFFVAPRTGDGPAVTDQLARLSPEPCAGSIRRLAAPDL